MRRERCRPFVAYKYDNDMKSMTTQWAAVGIATSGIALSTTLLATHLLGETAFVAVMTVAVLSALAVFLSPRLVELNLKEMKLVLDRIERVKAEIDAMYGGIENLKREPMKNDEEWHSRLGVAGGGLVHDVTVMNYVSGCMKRERERLAQIFILGNPPEKIAAALVDHTKDDLVFKWEPGEIPLDRPPRSVEDRRKAQAIKEAAEKGNTGQQPNQRNG
jgi:hypothetical protein